MVLNCVPFLELGKVSSRLTNSLLNFEYPSARTLLVPVAINEFRFEILSTGHVTPFTKIKFIARNTVKLSCTNITKLKALSTIQ